MRPGIGGPSLPRIWLSELPTGTTGRRRPTVHASAPGLLLRGRAPPAMPIPGADSPSGPLRRRRASPWSWISSALVAAGCADDPRDRVPPASHIAGEELPIRANSSVGLRAPRNRLPLGSILGKVHPSGCHAQAITICRYRPEWWQARSRALRYFGVDSFGPCFGGSPVIQFALRQPLLRTRTPDEFPACSSSYVSAGPKLCTRQFGSPP